MNEDQSKTVVITRRIVKIVRGANYDDPFGDNTSMTLEDGTKHVQSGHKFAVAKVGGYYSIYDDGSTGYSDRAPIVNSSIADTMDRAQLAALGQHDAKPKAPTGPRVTLEDIHAAIASEHYFTARDGVDGADQRSQQRSITYEGGPILHVSLGLMTFCVLVLKNGFTIVGKDACVSAENFDADLGRKYAHEDAISQAWPLLGFALADRLCRAKLPAPAVNLNDIEQYRAQMAGIGTAALGYWEEGDSVHPGYDTPALRDVVKLYGKYYRLAKAARAAMNELGVPQPGTPAPVQAAFDHLHRAYYAELAGTLDPDEYRPAPAVTDISAIPTKQRGPLVDSKLFGTYGYALFQLKCGNKVARAGWNGKGMWIEQQVPDANSKMTLPYLYLNYPSDAANTPGARVPWGASQTDQLAEDWGIVTTADTSGLPG